MTVTKEQFIKANERADEVAATAGRVTRASFDQDSQMVVLAMSSGVEVRIPSKLTEGLRGASVDQLTDIEITPSGLGLYWPQLDVDLYVPAAIIGFLGSEKWMAGLGKILGARGGMSRSHAKAEAARKNGSKGGRPRKEVSSVFIKHGSEKAIAKKQAKKVAAKKHA